MCAEGRREWGGGGGGGRGGGVLMPARLSGTPTIGVLQPV